MTITPFSLKLKTSRRVQIIHEMRNLVGFAGALCVFKDQQAVADFAGGSAFGVIFPGCDPETTLGVPRHLDGADQLGKLLFTGKKIDLHVRVNGHFGDGFLGVEIDVGAVRVLAGAVGRWNFLNRR